MKEKIQKKIVVTIISILVAVICMILVAAIVFIIVITPEKIITDIKSKICTEEQIEEVVEEIDSEEKLNIEYQIGEIVKVENEEFYVLRDCIKTDKNILLLAKENVDEIDLVQTEDSKPTAFSEKNYWLSNKENNYPYNVIEVGEPDTTHYAARVAYDYAKILGGSGRLLTYDEVEELKKSNNEILLSGKEFWISSADKIKDYIWFVCGSDKRLGVCPYYFHDICGVRPVIEISKSKVEKIEENDNLNKK